MQNLYSVYCGNKIVGKVQVVQQGLYYRIHCRCHISGNVIYRLFVTSGDMEENLGIVVPVDSGFGLETKIPVKRIGYGELHFSLRSKRDQKPEVFVPIYPEEPFSYIEHLKEAFLTRKNGQPGIMIKPGAD